MSQIIHTEVFTFDELSDAAKETAREWYRRVHDDDSFALESCADSLKELLVTFGWDKDVKLWYSLSYSQSDYASIEGQWRAENVKPDDETWERAIAIQQDIDTIVNTGCTYFKTVTHHRGGSRIDVACKYEKDEDGEEHETDMEGNAYEALRDALRSIEHELYYALRDEHEYQTADEQVDEGILANEYTFTANGRRFG